MDEPDRAQMLLWLSLENEKHCLLLSFRVFSQVLLSV